VAPAEAIRLLEMNTRLPGHVFWADELPVAKALGPLGDRVLGHQQITDGYLLGLAVHKKGALATLDQRLSHLLPEDGPGREALEVIPL
jgi:hypothetical protein